MATLNLPTHSYRLRSAPASCAELSNCYIEALPPDAKTRTVLSRAPGMRPFATIGTGPIRGLHTFDGDLFAVSGPNLYRMASDGTVTGILSTPIPGVGAVSLDHNVTAMTIVTNPDAFYTDGLIVTQITDADFTALGAKYVKFLDNYMTFMPPNSGRLFWADVGSSSSFDALNFVTAEGSPDDNVGIESDHQQLIVLGETSLQIMYYSEDGLVPAINGFAELGCFNGDTIAKLDNSIFWVANDFTVRRLSGATPQRVSTPAVEQFLSSVDVSTLRGYAYDQDGHFFYLVCCSTGCLVFDVASGEWANRGTYGQDYFRWQYHAYAHGRHYVGDYYTGQIAYFDPEWYKDGDDIQLMRFTTQPVYAENRLAVHHRIEIVMETGVGLTTGQGFDPEIMLAYSDDGGITWKNEPNRKIGKMGEYQTRVHWDALGSSRMRVYRFSISDPVKLAVTDIILTATGARLNG